MNEINFSEIKTEFDWYFNQMYGGEYDYSDALKNSIFMLNIFPVNDNKPNIVGIIEAEKEKGYCIRFDNISTQYEYNSHLPYSHYTYIDSILVLIAYRENVKVSVIDYSIYPLTSQKRVDDILLDDGWLVLDQSATYICKYKNWGDIEKRFYNSEPDRDIPSKYNIYQDSAWIKVDE